VYYNKLVNNLHRSYYNFIQTTQKTKLRVERVETSVASMTSVSSRGCSNTADDEEAVVLACTSLVFLCFVRTRKEKRQQAVWVKDYLRQRETFGC